VERNPDGLFLDLGCGLRKVVYENCLYLEVYPSICADLIVAPDCTYPIKSSVLDGVGCFAVLEHTRKPWLVVEEIARMLKPGGRVYVDWPFLQPVHGFPSHYYNATREGLRAIFQDNGFKIDTLATFPFQTPDYTINWILSKFMRDLSNSERREKLLAMTVRELIEEPPGGECWRKILSTLPDEMLSEFACGNSLIGTKV
jgi:SAM-dependent methyltransferase